MTPSDLPEPTSQPEATSPPSAPTGKAKAAPKAAAAPDTGTLVSVTMDTATGAVVRVEAVEPGGARHALSDEDRERLAGAARDSMEGLVERAFEAGIACVLGSEADEAEDAEDDAPLRRLLLQPLIEHSVAQKLLRREVLDRAALASLIRHARAADVAGATEH
jgi:hypothetical protein